MGRRDNIDAFRAAMTGMKQGESHEQQSKKMTCISYQEKEMSYLKGNYNLEKGSDSSKSESVEKNVSEEGGPTPTFEEFARTKLGGSIAFVMKNNTFVWTGPDGKDVPSKEGDGLSSGQK